MKKSNTMFNNKVFSCHRMPFMRPSMLLLYKVASEKRKITAPAAVARVMAVTQQRLKNWESRGISKAGALKAQSVFGIDSNELLDLDAKEPPDTKLPYETTSDRPLPSPKVTDFTPVNNDQPWPFPNVTEKQWNRLSPEQKTLVENIVKSYVKTGDPPRKEKLPAPTSAAA